MAFILNGVKFWCVSICVWLTSLGLFLASLAARLMVSAGMNLSGKTSWMGGRVTPLQSSLWATATDRAYTNRPSFTTSRACLASFKNSSKPSAAERNPILNFSSLNRNNKKKTVSLETKMAV